MARSSAGKARRPRRTSRRPARHTPSQPRVIYGVLGILQKRGRLLLIRRAASVRVPGVWCSPGGAIEQGECPLAALIREMREELGLMVQPQQRVFLLRKHSDRLVLHCWTARIVAGDVIPNPAEVAEARWLTPAQIRR